MMTHLFAALRMELFPIACLVYFRTPHLWPLRYFYLLPLITPWPKKIVLRLRL